LKKYLTYSTSIKRQPYDISTNSSESDLELPKNVPIEAKRPSRVPKLEEEIVFVKRFKANVGRIDWTQCLKEGFLQRYSIGFSFTNKTWSITKAKMTAGIMTGRNMKRQ
jgi:hypothetical protein